MRVDVPRAVAFQLGGAALVAGALLLGIGGGLPFRIGALAPADAHRAVVHAELFVLLVAWPLFLPRLSEATPGGRLLQVPLFVVVGLPLAVVAAGLSGTSAGDLLGGLLLPAAAGLFVTGLFELAGPGAAPGYFLGFFACSALLPFVQHLAGDFAGRDLSWLAALSPFWAAAQLAPGAPLAWAPLVHAGLLAAAGGALLAAALRRRVDCPAGPG